MSPFGRLLRLTAPFGWWVGLATLLGLVAMASAVALMATSAYLIAKAALATEVAELTLALAGVRLFAILRASSRYLERLTTHTATFRILAHVRAWFYEAIEPLAPARLSRYRSGDLLGRSVGDIETLENFYVRVLAPPMVAGLVVVFACVLLGSLDSSLAPPLLAFLLLAGAGLPLAMRRLGRVPGTKLVAARGELTASLVDEFQGAADLLIFDRAAEHRGRLLARGRELDGLEQRMAVLGGAGNAAGALLAGLACLCVLFLAVGLVASGSLAPVLLAAVPLAALASFEALQPLPGALQQWEVERAASLRIFELIDAPAEVHEPERPAEPPAEFGIEFRDVVFRYEEDAAPVLMGLSFDVAMGERLWITGKSGCGKSTIVNLLLRFWEYEAGEIRIGGRDAREFDAETLRACIGVVPQDVHLFNATVRDNLLLAKPEASDDEIARACRTALIDEFIEGLPQGYETLIGENGLLFSGGERQRLAIARMVLKDAPLIILDEPAVNLDARTEAEIWESLEPFLARRTVLVISHRPLGPAEAHRAIELRQGRAQAPELSPRVPLANRREAFQDNLYE